MRALLIFYRSPWIWGTHVIGLFISQLDVDSLSPRWRSLSSFSRAMGSAIPVIDNYASRSSFPETTRLYFSFMMIVGIVWFFRFVSMPETVIPNRDEVIRRWKSKKWQPYLAAAVIPLLACVAVAVMVLNPGYDYALMPINSNRLALGVFGPLFSILTSYGIFATCAISAGMLKEYFCNY